MTWGLGDGADESATRTLEIDVWLPWLAWNDATAQKAVEVVLDELEAPVGYFDNGTITVRTGTLHIVEVGISHTIEFECGLRLPDVQPILKDFGLLTLVLRSACG